MKITYLGQAGLLFNVNDKIILVDPYLSDSVEKIQPLSKRRQPIDNKFLAIKPDVVVITHNHLDHYDKETLSHYLNGGSVAVLSPRSVFNDVRTSFSDKNQYLLFDSKTTITLLGVKFSAVKAVHSDEFAIGVIIEIDGENYYITGDTLYSEKVFESLPKKSFKAVFLPINGVGNNMNVVDAKKFVSRLNVKTVVPIHVGLFDDMTGEELDVKNKIIPKIYKELNL